MSSDPTRHRPDPDRSDPIARGETLTRRIVLAVVVLGLVTQVLVAAVAFSGPRPSRFGWQMYTAGPYVPRAWAVTDAGEQSVSVDVELTRARAEIDRLALLRERGCELVSADAVRIELSDGIVETKTCD